MLTFVVGGMTGVLLVPRPTVLHNSLCSGAHFPPRDRRGVGLFAGIECWFPQAFGFSSW